jgi:hypothetical protein
MDCKTARLLFDFVRPRSGEVDSAELAAFEQHLGACPECDALARAERGVDRAFAKAMHAVEVPAGLRNRVMARLERERGDLYMRRFGHAGRLAAAAAAIALVAWGVYAWRQSHLPMIDMEQAWEDAHNRIVTPPGRDVLAEHFRRLGYDGTFPQNLNYRFVTYYGMGQFQGKPVPQLVFLPPNGGTRAAVLVLSHKQFNLTKSPKDYQCPAGYPGKVELWSDDEAGCAEVVEYTGASANWLRLDNAQDEAAN